jgi:acyl-CoA reductase-like NAD-dependent aldehyde dehydrogenase
MTTVVETSPMLIGGEPALAADGATIDALNPSTGQVIGRFPAAGPADVDAVVSTATAAFASWRRTEPQERAVALNAVADIIDQNRDELAALDVADTGSPIREMRRDADMAVTELRSYAGLVLEARGRTINGAYDRLNYTLLQPFGPVARIIPFNHPLMFAAATIAAPLAAGNTVIVKPSEHTSLSALRLSELVRGTLPHGVFNVVTGYGSTTGDALVRHPDIRRLTFAGAAPTGRAIQSAAASVNLKQVTLELGGRNPLVVFPDADLACAVAAAIRGMHFTWQGESCGSTARLLVHRDVYSDFVQALGEGIADLPSGMPDDEDTQSGAIVNRRQLDKVQRYLDIGRHDGARLVIGGNLLTDGEFANGNFVRPTLFADVDPHGRLTREDIFGPVLAAMPFGDYDEALTIANSVRYGSTASVFTQDLRTAHQFARDVEAAYVWVNGMPRHVHGSTFGGAADSGLGREEGVEELVSYLQAKNVHVKLGG